MTNKDKKILIEDNRNMIDNILHSNMSPLRMKRMITHLSDHNQELIKSMNK